MYLGEILSSGAWICQFDRTRRGKSWANCLARRFAAKPFLHVCEEIVVRNSPCKAVRVKSNKFDIFGLERQIPYCVGLLWESSWPWSIKHPIKMHGILAWLQCFNMLLEEEIPTPLKSHETAVCFVINCNLWTNNKFQKTCRRPLSCWKQSIYGNQFEITKSPNQFIGIPQAIN